MKKRNRMSLNKETIRNLTAERLSAVLGGFDDNTKYPSFGCTATRTCQPPPTMDCTF